MKWIHYSKTIHLALETQCKKSNVKYKTIKHPVATHWNTHVIMLQSIIALHGPLTTLMSTVSYKGQLTSLTAEDWKLLVGLEKALCVSSFLILFVYNLSWFDYSHFLELPSAWRTSLAPFSMKSFWHLILPLTIWTALCCIGRILLLCMQQQLMVWLLSISIMLRQMIQ